MAAKASVVSFSLRKSFASIKSRIFFHTYLFNFSQICETVVPAEHARQAAVSALQHTAWPPAWHTQAAKHTRKASSICRIV